MNDEIRIRLEEDDFRKLVAGQVVDLESFRDHIKVKIILADIGWTRMRKALDDASKDPDTMGVPIDEALEVAREALTAALDMWNRAGTLMRDARDKLDKVKPKEPLEGR